MGKGVRAWKVVVIVVVVVVVAVVVIVPWSSYSSSFWWLWVVVVVGVMAVVVIRRCGRLVVPDGSSVVGLGKGGILSIIGEKNTEHRKKNPTFEWGMLCRVRR